MIMSWQEKILHMKDPDTESDTVVAQHLHTQCEIQTDHVPTKIQIPRHYLHESYINTKILVSYIKLDS